MVDRITCPKCNRASYALSSSIHMICSYCGFDFHRSKPDRRLSKRSQIKEFITLDLNDQMRLKVNVVDTSANGVGVILSNPSGVKKGDIIRYSFGRRGKRGSAKVVWFEERKEYQKVGLLLYKRAFSVPDLHTPHRVLPPLTS